MSEPKPVIHRVTEGGVAAEHIALPMPEALVAPTHLEQQHNTLKTSLIPFACWRAHDMRLHLHVHQTIPAWFMQHARARSRLA